MQAEDSNPTSPAERTPKTGQGVLNLDSLASVLFTPARTIDELHPAFALVYATYLDRDYIEPNRHELRFGLHNLLPETTTFVALLRETVIATVTLVGDSPLRLPMDEIYHQQLTDLRTDGRRLGEVTMLADRRREFKRTLPMVLALFRTVMDYAVEIAHLDDLCITLNPRHADFYRRVLHFEDLGPLKPYDSVRRNPALAKRFPLENLPGLLDGDRRYKILYERTERTNRPLFDQRLTLTPEQAGNLVRLLPNPLELTDRARRHLQTLYGLDF